MPWVKGESGNPNGRPPKSESMTNVLTNMVDKTWAAEQIIKLAKDGDLGALKYIYDRVDGTPRQTVDHTGSMDFRILLPGDADADD